MFYRGVEQTAEKNGDPGSPFFLGYPHRADADKPVLVDKSQACLYCLEAIQCPWIVAASIYTGSYQRLVAAGEVVELAS